MRGSRIATLLALTAVTSIGPVVPTAAAQPWLGFRGSLGHEWLDGDIANPLNGDARSEWTVMGLPRAFGMQFRVGAGLSRVTYDPNPGWPNTVDVAIHEEDEIPSVERWNHVRWHVLLGWEFLSSAWVDLYVERRFVWGRLRSQTQLLRKNANPQPDKRTPHDEWYSSGAEYVVGLKSDLAGQLPFHLDVVLRASNLEPRNAATIFDLSAHGFSKPTGGSTYGFQIGVFWHP